MLVQVAHDALLLALQHVLRAVSANNPIPILSGVRIHTNEDGIIMTASNTSLAIQYRIPLGDSSATVQKAGAIVVPGRYFYEIIRKLSVGPILLEVKERWFLTIESGKSQIRLCGMDPVEFPSFNHSLSPDPVRKLRLANGSFLKAVKQTAFAASTSETRPVITGVSLVFGNELLHLMATDGIRLAALTIPINGQATDISNVIIPANNLKEVAKMFSAEEGLIEIETGLRQIGFAMNNLQIHSALIEGAFPSVKNIIPQRCISQVVMEKSSLLHAVERACVLAGDNIIRLSVTPESVELTSKTAELGETEEEVQLQTLSGDKFIVSLNGKLLMDILRCIDKESIKISYSGSMSPIMILPVEDTSTSLFLITPVRTASSFT